MNAWTRLAQGTAAIVLAAASLTVQAQGYPSKPIRVIVPYAAGGSGEVVGRVIGARLADALRQQVLVENRPGAAGTIGVAVVAKSPADGYTLLLGTDAEMAITPHIQKTLPYDPNKDFSYVVQAAYIEFMLVAHPSVPPNTLGELIAYAKANPGRLNYASAGSGSTHHLSMELLKSLAGITIAHVPYKGSGQILPDLIAGQVQLAYSGVSQVMPHVQSGKIKALATGAARRLVAAPNVPTIAETFPGFEGNASWNFYGPAGLPRDIVLKLNTEINKIISVPDIQASFVSRGLIPIGGSPEQLAARMRADYEKWGKVVREVGLKAD